MRVPFTLDLHISNFNYPDTDPSQVFDKIVAIAQTAETAGFGSVSMMDHLHQIPVIGAASNWMFEGSTMLAAIAARTTTLKLGLLVGSVTYRNPALAAKITTTIDIISGGRAWHGLGAGWFEEEQRAYGYEVVPLKDRFEKLEEALQISRSMFTNGQSSFSGKHFKVEGAFNNPQPIRGDIPIVVGGSGERKTLRLVARYADGCNLFGGPERVKHLLGVLEQHCADVGRDPAEITKTGLGQVIIGKTHEEAEQKVSWMRSNGVSDEALALFITGDSDTVGERVQELRDVGLEGWGFSMPDAHDLEAVELAGRTLAPIFTP